MPKNHFRGVRNLLALAVMLATLAGCAQPAESGTDDRPVVLTTFTVIADMARAVAGDAVVIESITKVGAEIHGYEPTPSDLRRASSADLILDNGLGLERWFEDFVATIDVPHVVLSEGVEPIEITAGDYVGRPNPHAWMSPLAGQTYVDNIRAALTDLVPESAATFAANADAYRAELQSVSDELVEALSAVPEQQRVLVSCEGAFSYLTRDAGLVEGYLWPVNSDTQGTPQQIRDTIELVRERDVPAVFCESTVSDTAQRQVARESGSRFAGNLYVDSLSEPDGPVPGYLELLRYDVQLIVDGLAG